MDTAPDAVFEAARDEFLAGLAHQQAGEFELARRRYEASLRLLPGRASTLTNLAAACLQLGDAAAALQHADAALAAAPHDLDALGHRGRALAQLGHTAQALAVFEQLTRRAPTLAAPWSHLGQLRRELGLRTQAAEAFATALRLGADPALHRFYLASVGGGEAPAAPPRAYVQQLFDGYAADFDAHLVGTLGYQAHEALVALARAHLVDAPVDDVLDLGCGTGLSGPSLRPLARRLTGLDLSAAMLERCRARGVYDRLVHADAVEHLAGTGDRFDLVVAADVLIYVGDPGPLLAALHRSLAPEGLWAFTVEEDTAACDDPAAPGWRLAPSLRYVHARQALLRQAHAMGFETLQVDSAPVRTDQGRAIDGLYVLLRRVPQGRAAA